MPDRYLYLPRVIPTEEPCHVELHECGRIQRVAAFPPSTFPQSPAFRGPGVDGRGVVDPRSGKPELWWAEGEAAAGDDDVRLELEPYKE